MYFSFHYDYELLKRATELLMLILVSKMQLGFLLPLQIIEILINQSI